jgi:tryptophanyl-tRNA synthetase
MTTRVFTGLKSTGRLQVGNYLGAIRPLLELTEDPHNELVVSIVDLHALTVS